MPFKTKEDRAKASKKWRDAHPEYRQKELLRLKEWAQAHPPKSTKKTFNCVDCGVALQGEQLKRCSICAKEATKKSSLKSVKKWAKLNPKKMYENLKSWIKRNPEKAHDAAKNSVNKRRAQKRGNGGSLTSKEWREIKASYFNKCVYCGKAETTMDHLVPLASGGKHNTENVVPACLDCNRKKNRKPLLLFFYQRLTAQ